MTALVTRRDYLDTHRRGIIARAVSSTFVSLIPLPFVDDWGLEAVLGSGYRRIAESYKIDLDETAIKNLVHGREAPLDVGKVAVSSIALKVAGKTARRFFVAVTAARNASAAARTYVTMTLFDHYCAKLHTGVGLDGDKALAIRDEIGRALKATPGALALHPFRRGLVAGARLVAKAPLQLANAISAGRVAKLLGRGQGDDIAEPTVVSPADQFLDAQLAEDASLLNRVVQAVEAQLTAEINPFLDAVIEDFERRWRARVAAGT